MTPAGRSPWARAVLALLAGLLVLAPLRVAPPAAALSPISFRDVPPGHTFSSQIGWLVSLAITTGYSDATFRPGQPVLREQMAAFLHRYAGSPEVADLPRTSPFTDVPTSHPFYAPMVWLSRAGVTTGYSDGTFRPGQPVLREQMAAFLQRLGAGRLGSGSCGFSDLTAFRAETCWLKGSGITTGYGDGTFRPGQPVLREQMAAFLQRFDTSVTSRDLPQPVVTGVVAPGRTVTAWHGLTDPAPGAVGYQWFLGSLAIVGATGPTYVATGAEDSYDLSVRVTVTTPGGPPRTNTSRGVVQSVSTLRAAGPVAADTTWGGGGIDRVVVGGDVTVASGATLTVAPGTRVVAESGRAIEVSGELSAVGSVAAPIRFTTPADAPGQGLWRGIRVRDGGSLDLAHAEVAHASIGVEVPGRPDGSSEVAAALEVRQTTFTDMADHAIRVADTATAPVVDGTVTTGAGGAAVVLSSQHLDPSKIVANSGSAVGGPFLLGGTVTTSGTLATGGLPFGVGHGTSGLVVAAGVTLTLPAGQVWASEAQAVAVEGELVLAGTASAPVVLGSGRVVPAAGDWTGIEVRDGGRLTATHAAIRHAVTGVKADRAPHVSITDSEISASTTGLFVYDGPPGDEPWTEQQVARTTFRAISGTAIVLDNARLVTSGLLVEQVGKVLFSEYASAVLAGQLSAVRTDPWVQALGTDPSRNGVDVTAAVTAPGVPMLPVHACGLVTTASGPAPAC